VKPLSDIAAELLARDSTPAVVSMDVFDTLLWRMLPSSSVDRLAVERLHDTLRKHLGWTPALEVLWAHRQEFAARREALARETGEEWGIEHWLGAVAAEWELDLGTLLQWGVDAQLYWERRFTRRAPTARAAVAALKAYGVDVVATSDTYLPDHGLKQLLAQHSLPIDRVFCSASLGVSKRHGRLFKRVLDDLEVEPSRLVHLGDNFKSDVVRAAASGCRYLWVPRPKPSKEWPLYFRRPSGSQNQMDCPQLLDVISCTAPGPGTSDLYRFGFQRIAPALGLFSLWQWRKFRQNEVTHSFYLAREGRLLLDAYNRLADVLPNSPRRHYTHLSRRAISGVLLKDLRGFGEGLPGKIGRGTTGDLLGQYPLDDALRAEILARAGVGSGTSLTKASRAAIAEACSSLANRVDAVCAEHKRLLADYLRQLADRAELGSIAVIDSGWAGTTQRAIAHSLDDDCQITGLYLGVSAQGRPPTQRSQKFGLIRDDYRDVAPEVPLLKAAGIIRAWEIILSEPQEPTTLGLHRAKNDRVDPSLGRAWPLKPALRHAREHLAGGVLDGVEALRPAVAAVAEMNERLPEETIVLAARVLARRALCYPRRDVARGLLEFPFHEGAVDSMWSSLDLGGLRRGVAWLPGILAKYRLRGLQGLLDLTAFMADGLR
jgi:FMN phosphatase YigB (HAD superfamily)